ncbi:MULTISPECIES: carbamoyltransferase family protein [Methylosinus]|uniref:Carbamoyltransferase n=1 Tax=Methylosinus trichosporium (strain ATCC 35070 / NCIMB 11131 / UNIQEM 75 / OB3b) TaxID=595536 RepID=A0A2D2D4L3_METT3|nr:MULTISPECIES: carbamoyltransferase C-terminal domain-containing protein [Methylosinus]ATQ69905.1 carbamoyltransferase [Methylosinus trichosporium OB3b]OBS53880.1 carbamoyltransferase [Methylosinus sp. 3S-1]
MIILGVNAFHGDAAACLLRDGVLVAAAEEERFRRIKHWAGFPSEAIRYCLREAGVDLAAVDRIALNQDSGANMGAKLRFLLTQRPDVGLLLERLRARRSRERIPALLARDIAGPRFYGAIDYVEHHLAHLASAFFVSPFEEAIIVSVDGFGDFSSAAWGVGRGDDMHIEGSVAFPHSLGVFYQAITQYLGFPHYGDEYKVMGLAPYGAPRYVKELSRLVRLRRDGGFALDLSFFRHHEKKISFEWTGGAPEFVDLFTPALEALLGPRRSPSEPLDDRHRDIARSAQAVYEEALFHLLGELRKRHGLANVALAGGCAMNSVANGKLRRRLGFDKVYVQSAAGDAGGAIGAACVSWRRQGGSRGFTMSHAYWGPSFDADAIEQTLTLNAARIRDAGCAVERVDEPTLCARAAAAVAAGQVVGWFEGRMEWGPRALGNRSILCDPRRADMKQILNAKIKRRESFRPFAPSVLAEATAEWFEEDDDVPFMMQVFQIRKEKRQLIPAVTHVDGSGRLQTVTRAANPLYHALISGFRDLTGVPMVLNTSFNENEPVVCAPQEALDCFLRTKMDALAMGGFLLTRDDGAG